MSQTTPSKSATRASATRSAVAVIHRLATVQRFVRHRYWIWPLLFAIVLAALGLFVQDRFHRVMQAKTKAELQTILNASVNAVTVWLDAQRASATSIASRPDVRKAVEELVQLAGDKPDAAKLKSAPALPRLRTELEPAEFSHGYTGFHIIDRNGVNLASANDEGIGLNTLGANFDFLDKVFAGQAMVSTPFHSPYLLPNAAGKIVAGLPVMHVVAPVRDEQGKVIAALSFRLPPEQDFTRLLHVGRMGESGETYAFDKSGRMISDSRFDDDLRNIGLLPADASSVLNVELRDPGANLMEGERPRAARNKQPLTALAQSAVAGNDSANVDGYRDYRGVPTVGAWKWLPEYGFGVGTEVDSDEAFFLRKSLGELMWFCFALLGLAALALFAGSIVLAKIELRARRATIEARRLGQYTLEEKIGEGAAGTVYRAHHAMLRRPTAIKLLQTEKTGPDAIARFEREVQITSQLTHPNTVAIFDYGRTPEGIFYYAMEYLEGINLEKLVNDFGPQPEGRVIAILRQMCGSLAEAHSMGLIHRDIKPANILLTARGGQYDVVKVLDFGLVKAIDQEKVKTLTAHNAVVGTPLYLAPEAIQNSDRVDLRSDLYAVGAVGYFLLTGQRVFDGETVIDVCMQQLKATPIPPSTRLGRPVSVELEQTILWCLEKQREKRPQTALDLSRRLLACEVEHPWTDEMAQEWWKNRVLQTPTRLEDTEQTGAVVTATVMANKT
jgi:eukaryotic-like serine/threonine-protein kinase